MQHNPYIPNPRIPECNSDDYIKLDGTETQQEIMKKAIDAGYA